MFTPEVYEQLRDGCQCSAERVVPVICDLIEPETVVDVGGGEGWWGTAFFDRGCDVVVADESVDAWRFVTGQSHRLDFLPTDLTEGKLRWANKLVLERAEISRIHGGSKLFDLAVCLEVAEHLPEQHAADLVAGLCALAPVILFSAAIPNQGGHGHINEQWPIYWAALFEDNGLACSDWLRWHFWHDTRIEPWYRQNMLLFATPEWFNEPKRSSQLRRETSHPHAVVHPEFWQWTINEIRELRGPSDAPTSR